MPWGGIDDAHPERPEVVAAGPLAGEALWLKLVCYASRNLTDGFIPEAIARSFGAAAIVATAEMLRAAGWTIERGSGEYVDLPALLVRVGLLEKVPGGYRMPEFLKCNLRRAEVLRRREERIALSVAGGRARAAGAARDKGRFTSRSTSRDTSRPAGPPAGAPAENQPSSPIRDSLSKENLSDDVPDAGRRSRVAESAPVESGKGSAPFGRGCRPPRSADSLHPTDAGPSARQDDESGGHESTGSRCERCRRIFKPRRRWARFCSQTCQRGARNDWKRAARASRKAPEPPSDDFLVDPVED